MLTKYKQDFNYISQDLLLPIWMRFSPNGLEIEIESALWRNKVELDSFQFTFIEDLSSEMKRQLTEKDYYE